MPDNVQDVWSEDELDAALTTLRSDVHTDERALGRTRAQLLATASGDDTRVAAEPSPQPSRRGVRWWVAAAAAAVAATVLVTQFGGEPPVASAAARELNSAADKIGAHDEPIGPGQYRYVVTRSWDLTSINDGRVSFSYLEERLFEIWMPADWRQEWLTRDTPTGKRKWIVGSERAAKEADLVPDPGPTSEVRAPCGSERGCTDLGSWDWPTWRFVISLPRDPKKLYDELRRQPGADTSAGMLGYLAEVLQSGLVPADLRAVMYRTLAMVPGVEITEKAVNLDGRTGIAFAATEPDKGLLKDGSRQELIIDPETGQLIGERQVAAKADEIAPAGTTTEYTSVTTAVVDGMGAKPTG